MLAICPPSHSPWFDHPNIVLWGTRCSSLCRFLQISSTSSLIRFNILQRTLFWNTHRSWTYRHKLCKLNAATKKENYPEWSYGKRSRESTRVSVGSVKWKVAKCQELPDDIVSHIASRYLWRRLGVSLAVRAILMTARPRKYLVLVPEEREGCHPGRLLVLVWPLR